MLLSPWDYSGVGLGFGLYRPRRPSYTYATQTRHRSESYRHATDKETAETSEQKEDFISGIQKKRKESYLKATRKNDDVELQGEPTSDDTFFAQDSDQTFQNHVQVTSFQNSTEHTNSHKQTKASQHKCNHHRVRASWHHKKWTPFHIRKNLILLCGSFVLSFTAFKAIQNLQSSINAHSLGIISMSCVHGTMFLTIPVTPAVIKKIKSKWALVLGMFLYLIWIGANFYPRYYTLIPTSVLAGFGQSLLWTAEISYIHKLAMESTNIKNDNSLFEKEVFHFHGVFLACFQSTHIWGNLISSLLLSSVPPKLRGFAALSFTEQEYDSNMTYDDIPSADEGLPLEIPDFPPPCGVMDFCYSQSDEDSPVEGEEVSKVLWKLMLAYSVLCFVGFCLVLFCLDKIGAQLDSEKSGQELIIQHVSYFCSHKVFKFFIPLLIFSGLQQGFIYSDFTKSYVACAPGVQYIGYSMIIMGLFNVLGAVLVYFFAKKIPREVLFGFGGILHIGLMIGSLIWIPMKNSLPIFFSFAAAWGICDSLWQTQCNTLLSVACSEEPDIAYSNYRMFHSLGLATAFISGTVMCVSAKLYLLLTMLVISIMFYVLAEYKIKQGNEIDFDDIQQTRS